MRKFNQDITIIGIVVFIMFIIASCSSMDDARAIAYVWVDSNCNSIPDANEVPLPGLCIWHGDSALSSPPRPDYCDIDSESVVSDTNGRWDAGLLWNRTCEDVYIFVRSPNYYQPTTDTVVRGCMAEFGFVRKGECPSASIMTPVELAILEAQELRESRICIALVITGFFAFLGLIIYPAFQGRKSEV